MCGAKKEIIVNVNELKDIIVSEKRCQPVTIFTKTDSFKMNKKKKFILNESGEYTEKTETVENPYIGKVSKEQKINGVINFIYENSVNRQLTKEDKEASFKSLPYLWKDEKHLSASIIEYKEKYYIQMLPGKSFDVVYRDIESNEEIDPLNIKAFISPKKQSNNRQGTDKEVKVNRIKLDNIEYVVMNKTKYIVK